MTTPTPTIPTRHLVEVLTRTGGAHLTCHGCAWNADIRAHRGVSQPLTAEEYARTAHEARALADAHRYSRRQS